MSITTPGEALRAVVAILRHNGIDADFVDAWRQSDDSEWFVVAGATFDPKTLDTTGQFVGNIAEDGVAHKVMAGPLGGNYALVSESP